MTPPVPPADLEPPRLLVLRQGSYRLVLAPDIGGSIASFSSHDGPREHHWLRPASPAALMAREPLGMASFPMVPWCNRIRAGRSTYGGRPVALAPNFAGTPHTMHGVGWQRPWGVGDCAAAAAELHLAHEADAFWPYRFTSTQRFTLAATGELTVDIDVVNRDSVPMPAGLGHHPYLPRRTAARLQASTAALWAADAETMPTALAAPPVVAALDQGTAVRGLTLDNNFTGWSRHAHIGWDDDGTELTLWAEAPLDYLVVYTPARLDYFCVEPASNTTDWMNLAQRGVGAVGGHLLAPGERLVGRFGLRPHEAS